MYKDLLDNPLNKRIVFHEDHPEHGRCYLFTNAFGQQQRIDGVTTFIKNYCHPFEATKIAKGVAFKRRRTTGWEGTYKDVLAEWKMEGDLANEFGDMLHNEIQDFVDTGEITDSEIVQAVEDLIKPYDVIASEFVIINPVMEVATQIDLILHDRKSGYVVWDWKTNKRIRFEGFKGQRMLPPFDIYDEAEYYKYSMQISFAVHTLRKHYKVPVSDQWLHQIVHFRNDLTSNEWPWGDETYKLYTAFDMTEDFEQYEQELINNVK